MAGRGAAVEEVGTPQWFLVGGFKFEAQRFLLDQALFLRTLLPV
jgi:hypothetical protein